MPRLDDRAQGAGDFNQLVTFYTMADSQDSDGGILRTPAVAYTAWAQVAPYLGIEQRNALREIGETWATFRIRYHRTRVPIEGMRAIIKSTAENYEVRGVQHIGFSKKIVECTCRQVK